MIRLVEATRLTSKREDQLNVLQNEIQAFADSSKELCDELTFDWFGDRVLIDRDKYPHLIAGEIAELYAILIEAEQALSACLVLKEKVVHEVSQFSIREHVGRKLSIHANELGLISAKLNLAKRELKTSLHAYGWKDPR